MIQSNPITHGLATGLVIACLAITADGGNWLGVAVSSVTLVFMVRDAFRSFGKLRP